MKEITVKMALNAWNTGIKQTDKLLGELSNDDLLLEIAPGKNRGIYLLGHLTAVHDKMFEILGMGEGIFPHYHSPFIDKADKEVAELPSVDELKQAWNNVNTLLAKKFASMSADDWFQRHTAVAEADFVKEPHRNKLNVLINRTNHLNYHLGQMVLLYPGSKTTG